MNGGRGGGKEVRAARAHPCQSFACLRVHERALLTIRGEGCGVGNWYGAAGGGGRKKGECGRGSRAGVSWMCMESAECVCVTQSVGLIMGPGECERAHASSKGAAGARAR